MGLKAARARLREDRACAVGMKRGEALGVLSCWTTHHAGALIWVALEMLTGETTLHTKPRFGTAKRSTVVVGELVE